jgi:hypothetical protein
MFDSLSFLGWWRYFFNFDFTVGEFERFDIPVSLAIRSVVKLKRLTIRDIQIANWQAMENPYDE